MSEMIERAAKAIADKWLEKADDATVRIGPAVIARAALSAALDPADNDLLVALSFALSEHSGLPYSNLAIEGRQARAVLECLRKLSTAAADSE